MNALYGEKMELENGFRDALLSCRRRNLMPEDLREKSLREKNLIEKAFQARRRAYVPYSHFHVGAAVETETGEVFLGCNVENASYGAANCAERTAIFKAVSEGHKKFRRIAIVGGCSDDVKDYCMPCGICRQVMAEFGDLRDFQVILAKSSEDYLVYRLEELLPHAFLPTALE